MRRVLLWLGLWAGIAAAQPPASQVEACYERCPRVASGWRSWALQDLENPGFRVGWSRTQRAPAWVAYALDPAADRRQLDPRPEGFMIDPRTFRPVRSEDYRGSGYDRGHLAANFIMSRFFGLPAQEAAMRMSNIAPQTPRLNRGVWQRLEMGEVDVMLAGARRLWVVTGPLWQDSPGRIGGGVRVPGGFYRLWVRQAEGLTTVTAFRVPQAVCGDEPPSRYQTSLVEIRRDSGLDFGPLESLPERALSPSEARALDRLPLRYARDFYRTPRPEGCRR